MSTVMARGGVLHGTMPMRATDPWQRSLAMALRLTDVSIVVLAGFLSYALRFDGDLPNEQVELLALTLGALLAAQCLAIAGCYDERSIDRLSTQLAQAVLGWSAAIGCTLAILFLIKQIDPLSRLWIGSWFVLVVVGLVAVRCLGKQLILRARAKGAFLRRVAIVREPGVPLERILDGIEMNPSPTPVAEMEVDFTDPQQVDAVIREVPRLGHIEHLVLVCDPGHTAALGRIVEAFRQFPVEVNLVCGLLASELPVIGMRAIGSLPATVLVERPLDGPYPASGSTASRPGAARPAGTADAARGTRHQARQPPRALRQMRVGFDRKPIEVSFRTMRHERRSRCRRPQATRDDRRVTWVGRSCAAPASTSCRSSSTCCAARCRWSGRARTRSPTTTTMPR